MKINQRQKYILCGALFLIWSFCLWKTFYECRQIQKHLWSEKTNLIADLLIGRNQFYLEKHLYPLIDTEFVEKQNEVYGAYLFDTDGKILAPLRERGRSITGIRHSLPKDLLLHVIEREIRDSRKNAVGTAFLVFHEKLFFPAALWILFGGTLVGIAYLAIRSKYGSNNDCQSDCHSRHACRRAGESGNLISALSLLQNWFGTRLLLFDERGNILNEKEASESVHILDLFSESQISQEILREMKRMEKDSIDFVLLNHPRHARLGKIKGEKKNSIFILSLPHE